jgi:hypothetical protein
LPFFGRRDKPPMDKRSKTLLVMMFYMWAGNVTGSHAGLLKAATATV